MGAKIINSQFPGKRVLVAPLDWGLGHTTRCIPIVKALLEAEKQVFLAGNNEQAALLQSEFSDTTILPLHGYGVKYSRSPAMLKWGILAQSSRLSSIIRKEHEWLDRVIENHHIDTVISDNRYGLHHSNIHSIFITHQLRIKTGFGSWIDSLIQKRNYKYINRFNECWIPDNEGSDNLAGELSHPKRKPSIPIKYIGPLSRFTPDSSLPTPNSQLLFLLSGPEPQRTIFENKILDQLVHYNGSATVVRGLPGTHHKHLPGTNHLRFFNHLSTNDLEKEINNASIVIARCGYSTVMDLAVLKKKCILIPTPGQPEQEYLAKHLQQKGFALCIEQSQFDLEKALQAASYKPQAWSM